MKHCRGDGFACLIHAIEREVLCFMKHKGMSCCLKLNGVKNKITIPLDSTMSLNIFQVG